MPKPERKAVILSYYRDNEVMLPVGMTHRQLVEFRDITFSERTTMRMLQELVDDGLMQQIDRGGHPLYTITDDGRAWLADFEQS
mgnify:FL=1